MFFYYIHERNIQEVELAEKLPSDDMLSDIHAKGDYRAHLIVEMAKRAANTFQ